MNLLNNKLNIIPLNIYIDPQYPVDKAIITHAHADHAVPGHRKVLATKQTIEIMKLRFGEGCAKEFQILDYGEKVNINNFLISLFPSGHILGSAQVLIENKNTKIVVTGDYKTVKDPTACDFEIKQCNTIVTEATFGLPIFKHPDPDGEISKLLESLKKNKNVVHLVGVYALGKAQRIIKLLRNKGFDEKIFIHRALEKICNYYEYEGIKLGKLEVITKNNQDTNYKVVFCPPSALKDRWSRRFDDKIICQASGWMSIKQRVKQSLVELPLIISDHSDWYELTNTIKESNAENVWVTHGREEGLVHWSTQNGLNSKPLSFQREDEDT